MIVHAIPEAPPACHVQEQANPHEIPDDHVFSLVQEQVNVHDISEIQAVFGSERVQQRTVERFGSHVHAAIARQALHG